METKTVHEQFRDFTELFAADGFQFGQMRSFLQAIEKVEDKTNNEIIILESFATVARLCRYFLDQNGVNIEPKNLSTSQNSEV